MKCDVCKKESQWLEIIGSSVVCHKCISKHKIMGLILRTHIDTFTFLVRKLKIENYEGFMNVSRKEIEKVTDLKKNGIILKNNSRIGFTE